MRSDFSVSFALRFQECSFIRPPDSLVCYGSATEAPHVFIEKSEPSDPVYCFQVVLVSRRCHDKNVELYNTVLRNTRIVRASYCTEYYYCMYYLVSTLLLIVRVGSSNRVGINWYVWLPILKRSFFLVHVRG